MSLEKLMQSKGRGKEPIGYIAAGFYFSLANLNLAEGNYNEAISLYDKVLEIDSKSHNAYTNRAVAKARSGNLIGAVVDCKNALGISPGHKPALKNLQVAKHKLWAAWVPTVLLDAEYNESGNVKLAKGNLFGAIAEYKKALKINPKNEDAIANLETATEMLNAQYDSIRDEAEPNSGRRKVLYI